MASGTIGDEDVDFYHRNGYVLVRSMFSREEIELLHRSAKADKALDDHGFGKADGEGGVVRLALWNHPATVFTACLRVARRWSTRVKSSSAVRYTTITPK